MEHSDGGEMVDEVDEVDICMRMSLAVKTETGFYCDAQLLMHHVHTERKDLYNCFSHFHSLFLLLWPTFAIPV